ncbi:MAG: hypothetical protein R3E47_07395 [Paracoccaceae bacterium]
MRYPDGTEIRPGDRLLWAGRRGIVVLCLDDGSFSREFSRDDWGHLEAGVLIDVEGVGLVHEVEAADLELLSRQ